MKWSKDDEMSYSCTPRRIIFQFPQCEKGISVDRHLTVS